MAATAHTLSMGRGRRWFDHAARVLLVAATAVLVALVALPLLGFRTLVVRSGSMAPAIETGDMVVSKFIEPAEAAVGDVVTFRDPSRESQLVTHRIVEMRDEGSRFSFVTSGDANGATETWSIDESGAMGKFVFRLPMAGYLVAWATIPWVRAALLVGAAAIFAVIAIRRIWASPRRG